MIQLILKRASTNRPSGEWNEDDYDVLADGAVVGRILKAHAMALHILYYNFVRIHQTLRTTPAMAAGVTKRLWEMADVVEMLEAWENSRH